MAIKTSTPVVPYPTLAQVDAYQAARKAAEWAQEALAAAQAPLAAAVAAHPEIEKLQAFDGTVYNVIRPQNRVIDPTVLKSGLKPSTWKLVTTTSVSLAAIDGLVKTGGIDLSVVAAATTYVDGKPYLKQG